MSKDPAFLFYSDNFQSGIQFFTDEQTGKYIRLLCAQHLHGHLTEKQMNFICKSYDIDVFSKFKKDEQGLYYNVRLDLEIEKRRNYSNSRSVNKLGKKKKNHKKIIRKSYDNHMGNGNENENENKDDNKIENKDETVSEVEILEPYPFDQFWELYDKKVGDKKKLEKKYNSLSESEKKKIYEYIPQYRRAQPDKAFRKNPETFLNNQSWNDEIITSNGKPVKQTPGEIISEIAAIVHAND